jgi:hypothetical protein
MRKKMALLPIKEKKMSNARIDHIEGESACEFMNRLIERRKKDKAAGMSYVYNLFEFAENQTVDIQGERVKCRSFKMPRRAIDDCIKEHNTYDGAVKDSYRAACCSIETKLDIPALDKIPEATIKTMGARSAKQILEKLEIYRKRAKFELKNLREVYSMIEEPQNPKTVGGLDILNWLYRNGNGRKPSEIAEKLYRLTVARERDKLFYVTRHPATPSLHVCQDFELLEKIQLLKWSLHDDPKAAGGCYGRTSF